ncbi:MAG: DUF6290 family protein [Pseudomonadota bacterium]
MLAVRLPEELERRLDELAKATGRTKSYYVREAIIEKLEDLEDIYYAEKVLEDIKAGRTETVRWEQVKRGLELED